MPSEAKLCPGHRVDSRVSLAFFLEVSFEVTINNQSYEWLTISTNDLLQ